MSRRNFHKDMVLGERVIKPKSGAFDRHASIAILIRPIDKL